MTDDGIESIPALAVVGQPNKGKSSIVATLAEDDSLLIAPTPGSTRRARRYTFSIDGQPLFALIDTPGFQRAAAALAWLEQVPVAANNRAARVAAFLDAHGNDPRFADECELLRPIVAGAGIIYVVDGAKPYGAEYEIEMQILRYTGQPRMALINTIGPGDYVADWRRALDQYFSVVRVFDAAHADYPQRLSLLAAFGTVNERWSASLSATISAMQADRDARELSAAREIAASLVDMLTAALTESVGDDVTNPEILRAELMARLQEQVRQREQAARREIQGLYWHQHAHLTVVDMQILTTDLFTTQAWQLFGLSKTQLLITGAVTGALAGSGIDLVVGGTSFMLGAGIGAALGAAGTLMGGLRVARERVLGRALGGKVMTVGPIRSAAFPWVLLGRAWAHFRLISERNHARRDAINLTIAEGDALMSTAPDDVRSALTRIFAAVAKNRIDDKLVRNLQTQVLALLRAEDAGT